MAHISGTNRTQMLLLPEAVEDTTFGEPSPSSAFPASSQRWRRERLQLASKTAKDDQETGHEFHVAFWTAKSANPLKLTKAGRLPLDQSSPAEFSHGLQELCDEGKSRCDIEWVSLWSTV